MALFCDSPIHKLIQVCVSVSQRTNSGVVKGQVGWGRRRAGSITMHASPCAQRASLQSVSPATQESTLPFPCAWTLTRLHWASTTDFALKGYRVAYLGPGEVLDSKSLRLDFFFHIFYVSLIRFWEKLLSWYSQVSSVPTMFKLLGPQFCFLLCCYYRIPNSAFPKVYSIEYP